MNLALAAFILTILFLPAVFFRLAINRQANLKELLSTFSITDSIWVFSVVPLFIHLVLISLITVVGYEIKFNEILNIIYSNKDYTIVNKSFSIDVLSFLVYNLSAMALGYALGILLNFLEEKFALASRILGLGNEWYDEIFSGNILPAQGRASEKSIDLVYVDILSNTKETTVLYSGILLNYYYKSKSNELDYLVLQAATRRDLRKELISEAQTISSGKSSHYHSLASIPVKIPGDYFIIPMDEVLNINVSYLSLSSNDNTATNSNQ